MCSSDLVSTPFMISRPVRLFWLLCACCVAFPLTAAANGLLAVDLDGDGRSDYVVSDYREPHVLHVWLSATDTTQIIRTRARAQQIAAVDLDGDHKPELVWRNGVKLHVLKRADGSGKFKRVRARRVAPRSQTPSDAPNAGDRDTDLPAADGNGGVDVAGPPRRIVLRSPDVRTPVAFVTTTPALRESPSSFAFVPRPPPVSSLL